MITLINQSKYWLSIGILVLPISCLGETNDLAGNLHEILNQPSLSGRIIQLFLLVSILTLAPAILIMLTSFVRITIVFSILRTALGLQQSPPNQVLVALALFLTFFIMSPTIEQSYNNGLKPLIDETMGEEEAIPIIVEPFRKFMLDNVRAKDLSLFSSIAKFDLQDITLVPFKVLVPSFMISELRKAFEMGFLIFLPFIIIDIIIASMLMAMGMMMMPPIMVALPFKIIFFVMIDGWYLLSGSLVRSFVM